MRISIAVVLAMAVTIGCAGVAAADGPACGATLTVDTTLTSDLTCSGDGLIVGSGATLDLGGHTISGTGTGRGVVLFGTVRNGTVTGFGDGVHAVSSTRRVEDLTVEGNGRGSRAPHSAR